MYRVLLVALCYLLFSFSIYAETILVVQSYHAENSWDASYKKGLEDVLGERYRLVYFEMDTKRIPESEFEIKADSAWELYQELKPALVVLGDDNALKYMGPKLLNVDTPVVYLGINANPRTYEVADASHFSGVLERPLLKRSILMLKKYYPAKKVLVLLDSRVTSQLIKEEVFDDNSSIGLSGIVVDLKLVKKYSEWKELVLTAEQNNYDALFVALYQSIVDDDERHVNSETLIKWTSENTPVPPFGFWSFSVSATKNVGGYVVSAYGEGYQAGEIALGMLEGKQERIRPRRGEQGRFIFSKTQLRKWNIELPAQVFNAAEFVD